MGRRAVDAGAELSRRSGRLSGGASDSSLIAGLYLYVSRQASSVSRYALEQVLFALVGWVPTLVGIGLRGYRG